MSLKTLKSLSDPVSYFDSLPQKEESVKTAFFEHELQIKKKAENLFARIVKDYGPRKNNLAAFNHFFIHILPKQLTLKVESDNTGIYWFENVRLLKPQLNGNPMFPRDARKGGYTYAGKLMVDACKTLHPDVAEAIKKARGTTETPVPEGYGEICISEQSGRIGRMVIKNLVLGEIPIMLGSESCHLYGYSNEELRRVGEDANDPFGYFIIKGGERVIIIQENICYSQPISKYEDKTTSSDKRVETRVTTPSLGGSTVVSITMGKKWPVIRVVVKQSGFKNATVRKYSMFSIFDALFQLSNPKYAYDPAIFPDETKNMTKEKQEKIRENIVNESIKLIERFITEENYEKVQSYLTASKAKYDTIEWPVREIVNQRIKGQALQVAASTASIAMIRRAAATQLSISSDNTNRINQEAIQEAVNKVESTQETFKNISSKNVQAKIILIDLFKDLFSNTESKDFDRKLILFARVIAQQMLVVAGARPVDNRDGWEIKRTKLPVDWFSQTFNGIFKITVDKGGFLKFVDNLLTPFLNIFGAPTVGGIENNIVHMVKRDTPVALISQIGRINVNANRQSKQFSLRLLQPSQVGYCCIAETPCSDACGLTKNLACSAWIALRRDFDKFVNVIANPIIEQFGFKDYHETKAPHGVFVDNYLIGWGVGPLIETEMRRVAKRQMEFFDVCIVYNPIDMVVDIFTTGSRPTRPLFTVDEEKGMLNIDKLPSTAYDWSVEKLIEVGAIEYVHAAEQQYIRVSKFPEDVPKIINERKNSAKKDWLPLYSEISPLALLGEAAALMPMPNTCQGPRVTYQSSMIGQAIGAYHDSYYDRQDTMFKRIEGTRATYETSVSGSIGLNRAPTGRMFIIAFLSLANNGEDGIVFKRECLERLKMTKYSTRKVIARGVVNGWKTPNMTSAEDDNGAAVFAASSENKEHENLKAIVSSAVGSGKLVEEFTIPPAGREESIGTQEYLKYHALEKNGLPRLGAIIQKGDCIIGRIRTFVDISGKEIKSNASEFAGVGDEGIVDRVQLIEGRDGEQYARVKIRQTRNVIPGDKFASRYSQKGTMATTRSNLTETNPGRGDEFEVARMRKLAIATGGEKALREVIVSEGVKSATAQETESEIMGVRFAKNLPVVASGPNKGISPDIIINSLAIPTRICNNVQKQISIARCA